MLSFDKGKYYSNVANLALLQQDYQPHANKVHYLEHKKMLKYVQKIVFVSEKRLISDL